MAAQAGLTCELMTKGTVLSHDNEADQPCARLDVLFRFIVYRGRDE
jgi:hypothetical protein